MNGWWAAWQPRSLKANTVSSHSAAKTAFKPVCSYSSLHSNAAACLMMTHNSAFDRKCPKTWVLECYISKAFTCSSDLLLEEGGVGEKSLNLKSLVFFFNIEKCFNYYRMIIYIYIYMVVFVDLNLPLPSILCKSFCSLSLKSELDLYAVHT